MRKILLPLLCLAVLNLSACAGTRDAGGGAGPSAGMAVEPEFDRTGFGNAPFPFWSALTEPEIHALSERGKAASGDPDALLALAIFASGDKREAADYLAIHARIQTFLAKSRPEIAAEKSAYKKGLQLLKSMHQAFFAPAGKEASLGGYDWNQSKLTGIFADGKFNCISSAILYIILARECGLKVKGVLLPSHAFVQLETPDGKIIEVETTTPAGFAWIHDENFYEKRAGNWFQARGLSKSTYKDYQQRQIVEPVQLIAYNMINQHAFPDRMKPVDRYRLIEARGYIDAIHAKGAQDRVAQLNRLDSYNTEYQFLRKKKDAVTLERMFRKIAPMLAGIHQDWRDDAEVSTHTAWLPFEYATVLIDLARGHEALPWIDSSLAWLNKSSKEGPTLYQNNLAIIVIMNQALVKDRQFKSAETNLARYPEMAKEEPRFRQNLAWFYNTWAKDLWNAGQWEACIVKFDRQLQVTPKEGQAPLLENITGAFLNWAGDHERKSDWAEARDVLKQCSERFPEAKQCRSQLVDLVAAHSIE